MYGQEEFNIFLAKKNLIEAISAFLLQQHTRVCDFATLSFSDFFRHMVL